MSKTKMKALIGTTQGRALWQTLVAGGVGLIAVATLLPAYLSTQERARQISGMQNLQQWGIALNLHLMDNAGQFPEVGSAAVDSRQTRAWYNALPTYLDEAALSAMPVGQRPRPGTKSLWMDPSSKPLRAIPAESYYFNYGMNQFLQSPGKDRPVRLAELPNPGRVIFMSRVSGYTPWAIPDNVIFSSEDKPWVKAPEAAPVLFCDGHAEVVDRKHLVDDPQVTASPQSHSGMTWFVY